MSNTPTTLETAETSNQNYGGELIKNYLTIVNGEGFHRKMADVLKNSPHDLLNKDGPLLKGNSETWRVTMGNNERKIELKRITEDGDKEETLVALDNPELAGNPDQQVVVTTRERFESRKGVVMIIERPPKVGQAGVEPGQTLLKQFNEFINPTQPTPPSAPTPVGQ